MPVTKTSSGTLIDYKDGTLRNSIDTLKNHSSLSCNNSGIILPNQKVLTSTSGNKTYFNLNSPKITPILSLISAF